MASRGGRVLLVAAALLIAGGLWQLGSAGFSTVKAVVAQVLMERAWSAGLAGGRPVRPWPWADGYPAARLVIPSLDRSLLVLDEAHPRNLAFGPARVAGSGRPGAPGLTVLAGHRDSHFAFLGELAPGTLLHLQSADGLWHGYRVVEGAVLERPRLALPPDFDGLALVTCWPLDALRAGGEQRYVVLAESLGTAALGTGEIELAEGF